MNPAGQPKTEKQGRPRSRKNKGKIGSSGESSNGDRQSTGDSRKAATAKELDILKYEFGLKANLTRWREKMANYAIQHFNQLGFVIEDDRQYWEPAQLTAPTADEIKADGKDGFLRQTHQRKIDNRMSVINDLEMRRPALFALIMAHVSSESEEAIKQDADWPAVHAAKCPRQLMTIILRTHTAGRRDNPLEARRIAREQYAAIKQFANETVTKYKERFDAMLRTMELAGVDRPDPNDLAMHFVSRLDETRFGTMQTTLHNNLLTGAGNYPDTVQAAYTIAANYKVNVKSNGASTTAATHTVFTATKAEGKKKKGSKGVNQDPKNIKKTFQCHLCGEQGHGVKECPLKASVQEYVAELKSTSGGKPEHKAYVAGDGIMLMTANEYILSAIHGLSRWDVLLDTQASEHLFAEPELLRNIRQIDDPFTMTGINGGSLTVEEVGDTQFFGPVPINRSAVANVLCYDKVADRYTIIWNQDDRSFDVIIDSRLTMKFIKKGRVYVYRARRHVGLLTTVEENLSRYTKRQVKDAEAARDLMERLGHPTADTMIRMIKTGSITNCPVTEHDVQRALDIWGPALAVVKGRTTKSKPDTVKSEYTPEPVQDKYQTLHMDVMFVRRQPYLITVSKPLNLTMLQHLESRSSSCLLKAVMGMLASYKEHGFQVTMIVCDSDKGFGAIRPQLGELGVRVNPSAAGGHAPVIERMIRTIKERIRGVENTLPYRVNKTLSRWLTSFCVSAINSVPASTLIDTRSPKERFLGRKLDYKRDLQLPFGQYVQVHARDMDNTMAPRTEGAISLMSAGNLQGSHRFYNLRTGQIVTRASWTVLPVSAEVIEFLNALAARDELPEDEEEPQPNAAQLHDLRDASDRVPLGAVHVRPDPEGPLHQDGEPTQVVLADTLRLDDDNVVAVQESVSSDTETVSETSDAEDEDDRGSPIPNTRDWVPHGAAQSADAVQLQPRTDPEPKPPDPSINTHGHGHNLRSSRSSWRNYGKDHSRKEHGLHISVSKALRSFGKKALKSMVQELLQMIDKKVWTPVNINKLTTKQLKSIIRSSMFLKEKRKPDGSFDKLKARLVAGGNMQDKSMYEDISSPTVATSSIFMIAAIAAREGRTVATCDIGGAYLNASMGTNEVLMAIEPRLSEVLTHIAPEYRDSQRADGSVVVKLEKALYGCVESAKLWYEHLRRSLDSLGFVVNPYDICVFNRNKSGEPQCTVCVHVDDLMITCADPAQVAGIVSELRRIYGEVTSAVGPVQDYLGMHFDFSDPPTVQLSMTGIVQELLMEAEASGRTNTPCASDFFKVDPDSPLLSHETARLFHSRVAKILYIAKRCRPDLLPLCAFLATRVQSPTVDDWDKLCRGTKYVNGAAGLPLRLRMDYPVAVTVYADASYGVHADGKSHSGVAITLGAGAIYAKSTKQKIVTKSSAEAELVCLSDCLPQVIHTRNFLQAQGYEVGAARVYQDNTSTITLAEKGRSTSDKTRHVNIRYFFVKDRIAAGEVVLEYLPTSEMVADVLTKPLQGALFVKLRGALMNLA